MPTKKAPAATAAPKTKKAKAPEPVKPFKRADYSRHDKVEVVIPDDHLLNARVKYGNYGWKEDNVILTNPNAAKRIHQWIKDGGKISKAALQHYSKFAATKTIDGVEFGGI